MFDLIIRVNMGARITGVDGQDSDDERVRRDYQRLIWEYTRLREYTEGIETILKSLPTTVTDWVAGITKGSPLQSGYEPPVEPE